MKIKILMAGALLAAAGASAQTSSPYSMYGYGIIGDRATSLQSQMGGVGYAMNSGRQINVMNPASYAAIDSLTFLFDLGADVSMLWSKEGSAKGYTTGGGVNYVTMQFPISKFMGGSVGLIPYSSVGYAFGNEIKHGALENSGSGGINQLYLGLSGEYAGFSLGANVSYDFGNIVNDVFATPADGGGQTKFEHVMQIRDWNINIGAQYTARWNHWNKLVIGATYSPRKTMRGKTYVTQQETTKDTRPDTVAFMHMKNKYFNPTSIGAGISYTYEKTYRVMVEADITWQQWSKAPYSALYGPEDVLNHSRAELVSAGMNFYDRTRYAVGAEIVPKLRGNYGERIAYRIGGYFANDYLNINGNRVREYGVTCGVGFPTPEGKTQVNLGVEWKNRSASPQKLVGENYLNVTLGVNFNEVWFWKRKIR
ncbi:MAG: hypothetical protein K2K97_02570 [Muribaculaceae bacterium]|nr:hypothetical protein [Muribaculaceae bacterium]